MFRPKNGSKSHQNQEQKETNKTWNIFQKTIVLFSTEYEGVQFKHYDPKWGKYNKKNINHNNSFV